MIFSKFLPAVEQVLKETQIAGSSDFFQLVKDEFENVSPDIHTDTPEVRHMRALYELRARYLDWELGTGYLGFFARNPGTRYTFTRRLDVVMQMLPGWLIDLRKNSPSKLSGTKLESTGLPQPRRILEIGCGAGLLCLELAQQADTVIGIDISHTALDFANRVKEYLQYARVFFQQSDAEQLAFADNSFDLVICSEVLEHVLNPRQALVEIRRVVKSGGTVIVTTPCAVSLSDLTMKALRVLFPHLESEQDVQFDKKTYLALQRKRETSPEKVSQSQDMLPEAVFLRVHERFHYRTLVNMFREAGFSVQRATGTILAFPPHYQVFYRLCPGWLLSGIRILENVFNNIGVFQRFGSVTTCFGLQYYGNTGIR